MWYRRYSCFSCSKCKELEFLDCTNKSAGKWAFKKFEIQSSILFKLFDTILGESQMIHWKSESNAKEMRSQKSKAIKKLIVAYLRSIEI